MESERLEILEGSWDQGLDCGHFAAAGSSPCCGDCPRALGACRTPSFWLKHASIPAAVFLTLGRTLGAKTNAAAPALPPELVTTATTNTPAETDQALRAYFRVQEQLHATLLAVEQARLESSQEARAHSEALAARLDVLERTLADQREQRWQTMHDSNRTMLVLAGSVVGLGIIALTLTVLFHSRGMNRLAEVASGLGSERALLADSAPGDLGQGKLLLGPGSTGQRTRPLLATIHRLERRLQEIEQSAAVSLPLEESDPANEPRSFSGGRNGGMGAH